MERKVIILAVELLYCWTFELLKSGRLIWPLTKKMMVIWLIQYLAVACVFVVCIIIRQKCHFNVIAGTCEYEVHDKQ